MTTYEFTFLLQDEKEVKKIKETLQTFSGKVIQEQAWGERTLSYPIKKLDKAKYFTWMIALADKDVNELRKKLNFNENIVRFLLLRTDEPEITEKTKK